MSDKNDILSRVLITGSNGMVGSYVDFGIRTNHRSLNVTDLDEVFLVCRKYKPKIILHLAAETNVEYCDRDPQHAYLVNTIGTYNMVIAAKELGAKFVYISTSSVFDGLNKKSYKEKDVPNPQGNYGRSKFLGEIIVKSILKDYIIGRICWVFGGGPCKDQKFVAKMISQTNQKEIKVISNKYGSPTYGKDLVNALKKMILNNQSGVFHMSNTGKTSRAGMVSEIVKITNSKSVVKEVDQNFFGIMSDNSYNNESMISKISIMRPWSEAIREYIEEEWGDYIQK